MTYQNFDPFDGIKNSGGSRGLGDTGSRQFGDKKPVRIASMAAPA